MKKHPWYHYLFPVMFVALSSLILIEGATPGNESGSQSKKIASLLDFGPKVASVISPESLSIEGNSVLYLGNSFEYKPKFLPENTTDQRVDYQILGDTDSVSIQGGTLTGKKEGKVTLKVISLANPSLEATMDIKVEQMKLTSIQAELTSEDILTAGMTSRLKVKGNTSDFHLSDVVFHSTDEDVLTIDDKGYIRTKKAGLASVYASSKTDGNVKSEPISLQIQEGTFIAPTSISVPEEVTLYVQEHYQVPVTFSKDSSDLNYQLEGTGLTIKDSTIYAKKAGDYLLKATSIYDAEIQDTAILHVKEAKATAIEISSSSIQYGNTVLLSYSLVSEKEGVPVTNPEVIFESSDSSVATIDENGNLIGVKKGSVDITVKWKEDTSVVGKANITITSLDGEKFDSLNFWVRKLIGHFGLFFVTGAFGLLTILFFLFDGKKKYIYTGISTVYGFALAAFSELFQVWAGGRTPSWKDVGIDTAGYVMATLLGVLIIYLVIRGKKAKTKTDMKKTT